MNRSALLLKKTIFETWSSKGCISFCHFRGYIKIGFHYAIASGWTTIIHLAHQRIHFVLIVYTFVVGMFKMDKIKIMHVRRYVFLIIFFSKCYCAVVFAGE